MTDGSIIPANMLVRVATLGKYDVACGKGSKGLMHYSPTSVLRVGSLIEARQPATIAFASHVVEGSVGHVPTQYSCVLSRLILDPQRYVHKVLVRIVSRPCRVVSSRLGF